MTVRKPPPAFPCVFLLRLAVLPAGMLGGQRADALPSLGPDPRWPQAGATVAAREYSRGSLRAIPDGTGGCIAAWQDARKLPPASCNCRNLDDLYAQRISADGSFLWDRDGLAVCTWNGLWGGADILAGISSPSPGSALVFWYHTDGPEGTFFHSISPDGRLERGADGATAYAMEAGSKWKGRFAEGGNGEIWLGLDGKLPEEMKVGGCIMKRGVLSCGTPVVLSSGQEVVTAMVSAGRKGRNVFVTVESRTGGGGTALRVASLDRHTLKARDPVFLAGESASDRMFFDCAPDGTGGLFVVWAAADSGGTKILGQRMDDKGRPAWGSGAVLGSVSAPVPVAALVHAASGRMAAAWADEGKLFVMPVTGSGTPAGTASDSAPSGSWPPPGVAKGDAWPASLALVLGDRVSPERRFYIAPLRGSWAAGWVDQGEDGEAVMVAAFDRKGNVGPTTTVFRQPGVLAELEALVPQPDGSLFVFWADNRTGGYPTVLRVSRVLGKGL